MARSKGQWEKIQNEQKGIRVLTIRVGWKCSISRGGTNSGSIQTRGFMRRKPQC